MEGGGDSNAEVRRPPCHCVQLTMLIGKEGVVLTFAYNVPYTSLSLHSLYHVGYAASASKETLSPPLGMTQRKGRQGRIHAFFYKETP